MQPSSLPRISQSDDAGADILGTETIQELSSPRPAHRPWYRHPVFIGAAILVVIVGAFVTIRAVRHANSTHYQTTAVTKGTLTLTVSASGNVSAPEYDVSPTIQGTISSLAVTVGQVVQSGDTLATLSYVDAHGVSQTETLTAPNAGTVVAINGVVNGKPTQSAFIVVDDLTATSLVLAVNEADIAGVVTGQAVTFTTTAYASLTTSFKGTVAQISADGQNANNVITYPVTVSIDGTSLQGATLFPQMTVNASIITAQRDQALLIPASAPAFAQSEANTQGVSASVVNTALRQAQSLLAQVQKSDAQATQDDLTAGYVLEVQGNRKEQLKVVPVVLGLSDGTNTQVLAGLSAGADVVTG